MILKLIIRNLLYKPLSTFLSWILLLFGVAIISLLLTVQQQMEQQFSGSLNNIDMVVGAKGSPLQLVLSAVYHADAPTGNIKEEDVEKVIHNPMIETVIPLAYGDSYKGFSITGTDSNYIFNYNGVLKKGRLFQHPMEAVIGCNVAASTSFDVDSTFYGTHGRDGNGHQHKEHAYVVKGVLLPTGTTLDNLVITNVATVRMIHENHHHADEAGEYGGEKDEEEHTPELTALLVKFRSPMGLMLLPRIINENTNMQAASPVIEMNRLFNLMGIGVAVLQYIAIAIMVMAALSVFVALFNRLNERKYELALMRTFGYSRWQLFAMMQAEGVALALAGFIAGMLLSRLGLYILNSYASQEYHITLDLFRFSMYEWWLLWAVIAIGMLASLLPAITILRIDISKTLTNE